MNGAKHIGTPIPSLLIERNPIMGEVPFPTDFSEFMSGALKKTQIKEIEEPTKKQPETPLLETGFESDDPLLTEEQVDIREGRPVPINGSEPLLKDQESGPLLAKDADSLGKPVLRNIKESSVSPSKALGLLRSSEQAKELYLGTDSNGEKNIGSLSGLEGKESKIDQAMKQANITRNDSKLNAVAQSEPGFDSLDLVMKSREFAQSISGNRGINDPKSLVSNVGTMVLSGGSVKSQGLTPGGTVSTQGMSGIGLGTKANGAQRPMEGSTPSKVFDSKEIDRIKEMLKSINLNDKKIAEGDFKIKEGLELRMKADPTQKTMTLEFTIQDQNKAAEMKASVEMLVKQMEGVGYRIQTVTLNGQQMNFAESNYQQEQQKQSREDSSNEKDTDTLIPVKNASVNDKGSEKKEDGTINHYV